MGNIIKKFLIILLCSIISAVCTADVLLWQINPEAKIADSSENTVYTYLQSMMPIGENQTWAAQIYVKDADGNILRTLDNISGTSTGNSWDRAIDANSLVKSPAGESITAESQAHNSLGQGNYYQIHIKLGTLAINSGNYIYQDILYSANFSGRWLEQHHDYNFSYDDDDSMLSPWTPEEFYTNNNVAPFIDYHDVPEPNSAILLVIGISALMLKRKKKHE